MDNTERRLENLRRILDQIDERGRGQTLTLLSDISGARKIAKRARASWIIVRNAFRRRLFTRETARAIEDIVNIYEDIKDTLINVRNLNQTGHEWSKIQTEIFNAGQEATAAYRKIGELQDAFEQDTCTDFSRPPAEGFVGVSYGKRGGSTYAQKPTSYGKPRSKYGSRKK